MHPTSSFSMVTKVYAPNVVIFYFRSFISCPRNSCVTWFYLPFFPVTTAIPQGIARRSKTKINFMAGRKSYEGDQFREELFWNEKLREIKLDSGCQTSSWSMYSNNIPNIVSNGTTSTRSRSRFEVNSVWASRPNILFWAYLQVSDDYRNILFHIIATT